MSAQCWITNIYQQRTSSKSHIYTRVVRDAKPNESKAWNSKRRQWELSAILGTVGDNIMRLPFGSPCDTRCLWFTRPTAPTRNPQRHSCDSITSDRRKVRKAFPRWLPQSLFSSSSFALTIYHPVHLDRLQFPGGVSLLSTGVSGAPGSPQGQWEGRGLVRPPDLSQGDGSVGPTAGLMSCLTGQTIDVRQIDGCAIKRISKLGNLSNITVNTMDILYYISLKAVSL